MRTSLSAVVHDWCSLDFIEVECLLFFTLYSTCLKLVDLSLVYYYYYSKYFRRYLRWCNGPSYLTSEIQQEVLTTKRKFIKPRSKGWNHFTKSKIKLMGVTKTRYNYYSKDYIFNSKNNTSSIISYLSSCSTKSFGSAKLDLHSRSIENNGDQLCA